MKKAGLIIMVFGLLITIFTGFRYVTTEKIIEIGDFEITADKTQRIDWSPLAGLVVIVVGGIMFYTGEKES
jgi:cytochrome oxidase Cu insertion factor (SCO1/SenC/PrrC family)